MARDYNEERRDVKGYGIAWTIATIVAAPFTGGLSLFATPLGALATAGATSQINQEEKEEKSDKQNKKKGGKAICYIMYGKTED